MANKTVKKKSTFASAKKELRQVVSSKPRSNFSSNLGFVLAAAGSAVGLGNLWRFPYLTAKYGGGMFLLCYVVLAVTFGVSLLIGEITLGRKTRLSAICAFSSINKNFNFLGILCSLVPIIITPYYCVIGGWVFKYLWAYITMPAEAIADASVFTSFISNTYEPLFWFMLFLFITVVVVLVGVEKGIEKVSTVLMPILVLLVIILAIYTCSLPGAIEGVKYFLIPNIKDFSPVTILAAMTQLFYSLSLAMGIMITYGSYLQKNDDIEKSSIQIAAFDSGLAIIAGLVIIPAVFAVGDPSNLKAGPSLMFIILPQVFAKMAFGKVIAILFFFLVFFAAITSSISLFETITSIISDKFTKRRSPAIAISLFISIVIGLLASLGFGPLENVTFLKMGLLDTFDFISNSVLMPIVAFFTCIFIGWVIGPKVISQEVKSSGKFNIEKMFIIITKYVAPILILIILVASILQGLGMFSI